MTEQELQHAISQLITYGNQLASLGISSKISLADWSNLGQIEQVVDLAKTTIDCLHARLPDPHRYVRMPQCEAGRAKAEANRTT